MRISDWSSDVCSSDLFGGLRFPRLALRGAFLGGHLTILVRVGGIEAGERRGLELGLADRLVAVGIGLAHHHAAAHAVASAAHAVMAAHTALAFTGIGALQIGRAHVCTPVTNAHRVCRLLLAKTTYKDYIPLT